MQTITAKAIEVFNNRMEFPLLQASSSQLPQNLNWLLRAAEHTSRFWYFMPHLRTTPPTQLIVSLIMNKQRHFNQIKFFLPLCETIFKQVGVPPSPNSLGAREIRSNTHSTRWRSLLPHFGFTLSLHVKHFNAKPLKFRLVDFEYLSDDEFLKTTELLTWLNHAHQHTETNHKVFRFHFCTYFIWKLTKFCYSSDGTTKSRKRIRNYGVL